MANGDEWHKGSRFWRLAPHALYLAALMVFVCLAFRPAVIVEAFGVYGATMAVLFGGGTWTNLKERDVAKAQVEAAKTP